MDESALPVEELESQLDKVPAAVAVTAEVAKNNPALVVGAALIGLAAGAVAGYFYAKKKLTSDYDKEFEREIENMREFYEARAKRRKEGEYATPESAAQALLAKDAAEALSSYQGEAPVDYQKPNNPADIVIKEEVEEVQEVEVRTNIFTATRLDNDFDYAEEVKHRDPETPYVISHEEFMQNENDYIQNTLTYYAGDDVLADDRETPVEDVEGTVGSTNLARFGHGSGDKNVVYIRNERLDLDFEVVYDENKYAEKVLGYIEHSDSRRHRHPRRFGPGDDE